MVTGNVIGVALQLNNGVVFTIKPSFEGNSVSYYNAKPIVKLIRNTNFSDKIYRVSYSNSNKFGYIVDYGEGKTGCSQWDPTPLACHMSSMILNGVGGYEATCQTTNTSEVSMCDNIMENLKIIVQNIK